MLDAELKQLPSRHVPMLAARQVQDLEVETDL